jgi:hypothetical protein
MDMKARMAPIEARPDALTIDVSRTAVIVVDMQNDFGSKGGMFDRAGLGFRQGSRHGPCSISLDMGKGPRRRRPDRWDASGVAQRPFQNGASAPPRVVPSALAPASIAGRMKVEIFQAACNTLKTVAVRRRKWNLR